MNPDEAHNQLIAALRGLINGKTLHDLIEVPPIGTRTRIGKALVEAQALDEPFHAEDVDLLNAAFRVIGSTPPARDKKAVAQDLIDRLVKKRDP